MASASNAASTRVVPLRQVRSSHLEALLNEETGVWRDQLAWDFNSSADLVRRFVDVQSLSGHALLVGNELAGYCYFVYEEHKGLIGDLYVRERFASEQHEDLLLGAALRELMESPFMRRIESQLMVMRNPLRDGVPQWDFLTVFPRYFMTLDFDAVPELPPAKQASNAQILEWSDGAQEEAAKLISSAYRDHVDSEINDQYRTPGGARRFLTNIVQYPGCGAFYRPASSMAFEPGTGRLVGICLCSTVAHDSGHITQVCLAPDWRGRGLGYEMMRRGLASLRERGCVRASLTVTAINENAVALYERMGFVIARRFAAFVWEGF